MSLYVIYYIRDVTCLSTILTCNYIVSGSRTNRPFSVGSISIFDSNITNIIIFAKKYYIRGRPFDMWGGGMIFFVIQLFPTASLNVQFFRPYQTQTIFYQRSSTNIFFTISFIWYSAHSQVPEVSPHLLGLSTLIFYKEATVWNM